MADDFAEIARTIARQPNLPATLNAIVAHAAHTIPAAEEAAITVKQGRGKYQTVAATGDLPIAVDTIQYETEEGPCVDSLRAHRVFHTDDLAADGRWPVFGRLATRATPVMSMLSHPLYLEDEETLGALNLYSTKPAAFTTTSVQVLNTLATHSAIAIAKANAEHRSVHLQVALATNRTIGVAIGILMATYKMTEQQCFDILRMASQNSHRKLRDVALGVVDTGTLDLRP
ncbi:GAF and ANTAR domain-containing protein [Jatrophihabitans sp. DSM 45814]